MSLTLGSLCSGVGGLELGVEHALAARTVWQSEIDPHASKVLAAHWPGVPNLGDLTAVDWAAVEPVDIMCFGFPCQDISSAGRRAGLEGDKSGLWFDCADAVRLVRPRWVLVENVAALLVRGFGRVLGDLAEMGYVGRWGCLRSSDIGAPHRRERIFIAATDSRSAGAGWHTGTAPRAQELDQRRQPHNGDAPVARRAAPAHTEDDRFAGSGGTRRRGTGPADGCPAAPDTDGDGLGRFRGSQQRAGKGPRPDIDGRDGPWGDYGPAVRQWEAIHGPAPTARDAHGRLNPALPEWMLGYPPGWVTDLDLPRTAQLRVLGNAVQPQVAELAARLLLAPLLQEVTA